MKSMPCLTVRGMAIGSSPSGAEESGAAIDSATALKTNPAFISVNLRRLAGAQKLEVAGMLYRTALSVKTAGLRRRHPDWPEAVLHREAARNLMLSSAEA